MPDGGVVAGSSNFNGDKKPDAGWAVCDFISSNPVFPGQQQIYVRDLCTGVATGCTPDNDEVSGDPNGLAGATQDISYPSISADGHYMFSHEMASEGLQEHHRSSWRKTGY